MFAQGLAKQFSRRMLGKAAMWMRSLPYQQGFRPDNGGKASVFLSRFSCLPGLRR